MISVRPIAPGEWPRYRAVRLEALRDSPNAFGSTLAAEMAQPNAFWLGRLAAAATSGQDPPLFALDGETVCGLLWCKLSATEAGVANLFQMWVAPASRGQGAGGALLDAAMDWARRAGAQRVRLSVTAGDSPARRLYEGRGFRAVGPLGVLREKSGIGAQSMELQLLGNSLGSALA